MKTHYITIWYSLSDPPLDVNTHWSGHFHSRSLDAFDTYSFSFIPLTSLSLHWFVYIFTFIIIARLFLAFHHPHYAIRKTVTTRCLLLAHKTLGVSLLVNEGI